MHAFFFWSGVLVWATIAGGALLVLAAMAVMYGGASAVYLWGLVKRVCRRST